jgi:hypothetical protein
VPCASKGADLDAKRDIRIFTSTSRLPLFLFPVEPTWDKFRGHVCLRLQNFDASEGFRGAYLGGQACSSLETDGPATAVDQFSWGDAAAFVLDCDPGGIGSSRYLDCRASVATEAGVTAPGDGVLMERRVDLGLLGRPNAVRTTVCGEGLNGRGAALVLEHVKLNGRPVLAVPLASPGAPGCESRLLLAGPGGLAGGLVLTGRVDLGRGGEGGVLAPLARVELAVGEYSMF